MYHVLKIESQYFEAVECGDKPFEIRYNDRGYQKGDIILLEEFDGVCRTGRKIEARITYVTGYQQKDNFVVFGIDVLGSVEGEG